jgi:hypothetical protein
MRHVIADCRLRPEETWILCSCGERFASSLATVEKDVVRHRLGRAPGPPEEERTAHYPVNRSPALLECRCGLVIEATRERRIDRAYAAHLSGAAQNALQPV